MGEIAILSLLAFPLVALIFGIYERNSMITSSGLFLYSFLSALSIWVAVLLMTYLFSFTLHGRWITAIGTVTLCLLFFSGRAVFRRAMTWRPIRVKFLGDDVGREFLLTNISGRKIKDIILLNETPSSASGPAGISEGGAERCNGLVPSMGVDWLVIQKNQWLESDEMILECLKKGIRVDSLHGFVEENFFKTPVEFIGIDWLIMADKRLLLNMNRAMKRAIDVLLSGVAFVVTLPLWAFIGTLIKIQDGGPVFYRQTRVGRNGRHFQIMKFRSMTDGCESTNGPQWACRNDPRVTTVGKLLRKTRMDELPQFLNILLGDMSLVGPRPERPEFVEQLRVRIPHYDLRNLIRPGISGWAQINFRYGNSFEDSIKKLSYDLYYLKNGSILLDLYVILRTLMVMAKGSR
jgi:exopolysaccharide biosynthesis polyprenyl glycosylphosphotransferase